MRILFKTLRAIAFFLVLAAFLLATYDYIRTRDAFPPGTFISGIDVSYLSRQEAILKLKKFPLTQIYSPLVTFEAVSKCFSFPPEKIGAHILYTDTVENAFAKTHKGNYFEQLKSRITEDQINALLVLDVKEGQLEAVLTSLVNKVHSSPKNATIKYYEKTGGYNINADNPGRELNIKRSIVRIKLRLSRGEKVIPLVVDFTKPKITEKELRAHPPAYRLSAYTTYYGSHDSPNRIHNIKLIASWIDGTILMPGDIFSVADTLGDVTEDQGFKEAFVIIQDELVPTLGGGACQIATTLFNTVSLADLKVLQRRNHSFYFNIYPLGRDATVYPGQVDFQFENDSGYPIMIKAIATTRRLSFRIYGTPTGKEVKFSNLKVLGKNYNNEYSPMSLKKVIDENLPFKTFVTRTVYDKAGKKIDEDTIASRYKLYGDKENVPIRRPEPR